MESLNNSLLARLGWKMTINAPLLWVDALRGKYLRNGVNFLSVTFSFWKKKNRLINRSFARLRLLRAHARLTIKASISYLTLEYITIIVKVEAHQNIFLFIPFGIYFMLCF
jgi:hypothetical protein